MPLIEVNQIRYVCASIRLDEVTAAQVDQYAAFIHASADDVVGKALNYVFSKDRDFQGFMKTPEARQVPSTLRVRSGRCGKEAGDRDSIRVFDAGGEALIRLPIRVRSLNGASHRKNFDTPPLPGNCPDAFVSREIRLKTQEVPRIRYLPRSGLSRASEM